MMDCWTQRANVYIYIYFLVNSVVFEWCISFNLGPINTTKFENAPDLNMLFLTIWELGITVEAVVTCVHPQDAKWVSVT